MTSKVLNFINKNGETAYNPTVPFFFDGKNYMGIRLEPRDSQFKYKTYFSFELDEEQALWEIDYSIKSLPLQDPTYTLLNGEIIVSGINAQQKGEDCTWHQEFYRGHSIKDLEYFTSGPELMKNIRIIKLEDRIGIFTRPIKNGWGNGKIGYFEIGSIEELTKLSEKDWYEAKIIPNLFQENYWGGVSQPIKLSKNKILALGHEAHITFNEKNELTKNYVGVSFEFDTKKCEASKYEVIVERKDFPKTLSKRSPELDNVVFLAGIYKYKLYAGLSDYSIGVKKIRF